MTENFKCTSCGFEISEEDADFQIVEGKGVTESASLVCPTCHSKIELTAMLVEPGKKPEEEMPQEEPVPGEEEAPEDEEAAPEGEAPAGQEAPPAGGEGGAPEQITAKESVDVAIDSLLNRPMKIHSMRGFRKSPLIREGKYIDLTPSPAHYRHMLNVILRSSKSRADKEWAKDELQRVSNVQSWKNPREVETAQDVHTKVGVVQDEPSLPMESLSESFATRLCSTNEQEEAVAELEGWLKSLGKKIVGGTTVGKSPQAVVLDLKYQGGEIHVSRDGEVTVNGSAVSSRTDVANMLGTTTIGASVETNIQIGKQLSEAEKEVKEWEGDFANFNSKIFSACKDLDLSPDKFEQVILDLQNAEAIELNRNKVVLSLDKTRKVFIELLTGQVQSAEDQSQAVSDLHEPPQKAPDLGNAPSAAAPIESISEGEEKKDVEAKVDAIIKKYFV